MKSAPGVHEGKGRLLELEKQEREHTGIRPSKWGSTTFSVFHRGDQEPICPRVPLHYVRKQTTANGERSSRPELKEFETRVLGAQGTRLRMESVLLEDPAVEILKQTGACRLFLRPSPNLTRWRALAEVAERGATPSPWWTIPDVFSNPGRPASGARRSPSFRNACFQRCGIKRRDPAILILTGPNIVRQVDLSPADGAHSRSWPQMGSYVPRRAPASASSISSLRGFGASDRLTEGEFHVHGRDGRNRAHS